MEYIIPDNAKILDLNGDYTEKDSQYSAKNGLYIKTDNGDIKLLIDDSRSCCESFGTLFLETPDNTDKFLGATILKIEDVCIGLTADTDGYGFDSGGETQLKITTDKGVLQYAVYNAHNGYYSHGTFLQVFDFKESAYL